LPCASKEKKGGHKVKNKKRGKASAAAEVGAWRGVEMVRWSGLPAAALDRDPAGGLNQLTELWRKLLLAAVARDATGLSVTGCRSNAADLTGLGGWVASQNSGRLDPRIQRCGVMPLMAGRPGLSLPQGEGCSGGVALAERAAEVAPYSGGDERRMRGRSMRQWGSGKPPMLWWTRGEARGLSLTDVPKSLHIRRGWARRGDAVAGRTKSGGRGARPEGCR
jgi:hypothetical protein